MAKNKTNSPEIKLSAAAVNDGTSIPVLSFGATATASKNLTSEDFHIQNPNASVTGASPELDFTGYYDASHKLVFVLDKTMDERTPNTLLVINHDADNPDRKWDDILINDYQLDVNTIRPKKDNKYQKLDIEYSGLSVYNNVINAHKSGDNMSDVLLGLSIFRDSVARRTAGDRLVASEQKISAANGTIKQTAESIQKLKDRHVALREKLSKQKKAIGKEPTKESAAKILKTESQIDDVKEKLKKANKRLRRAESRLEASRSDANDARKRLGMAALNVIDANKNAPPPKIPEQKIKETIVKQVPETFDWKETAKEPEVEIMPEENVNPLFDKDPNIMNEEIAFKPISFDMPSAQKAPESAPEFTAPVYSAPAEDTKPNEPMFGAIPVPNSFPEEPTPQPTWTPAPPPSENEFIPNNMPSTIIPAPVELMAAGYNEPTPPQPPHPAEEFVPVPPPTYAPTPIERPASPTSGPVIPPVVADKKKNPGIYYLLLVALIALSIFTLWLYQKRMGNESTPNITEPVAMPTVPQEPENPFLMAEQPEPEPYVEVVTPDAAYYEPQEPAQEETYTPEPEYGQITTPAYQQPEEDVSYRLTEEEILNRKPEYNIPDSEFHAPEYAQPMEDEIVIVSGQVIHEPDQPAAEVYYNYERREFEPVAPTHVVTHGVDVSELGEPDHFHETYDSYESYEEYQEETTEDSNYYY